MLFRSRAVQWCRERNDELFAWLDGDLDEAELDVEDDALLLRAWQLRVGPLLLEGLQMALTFTLVSLTWVWFRAESVEKALFVFSQLGRGFDQVWASLRNYTALKELMIQMGFTMSNLLISAGAISVLIYVDVLRMGGSVRSRLRTQPPALRWAAYYALVASIVFLGVYGGSQFIYFQF